ncbi:MAG: hypothetical protein JXR36_08100 [Bacteroidales bacterium]|nr:hypothetical protein [Bacteroidales bacterium]
MNTIKIEILKAQFIVNYKIISEFRKNYKILSVKLILDDDKVGTIDFSEMLSNKQRHQIIKQIAISKKKAELYNSPLIDEILNTIDPIEAKRIEKEMIESARL